MDLGEGRKRGKPGVDPAGGAGRGPGGGQKGAKPGSNGTQTGRRIQHFQRPPARARPGDATPRPVTCHNGRGEHLDRGVRRTCRFSDAIRAFLAIVAPDPRPRTPAPGPWGAHGQIIIDRGPEAPTPGRATKEQGKGNVPEPSPRPHGQMLLRMAAPAGPLPTKHCRDGQTPSREPTIYHR